MRLLKKSVLFIHILLINSYRSQILTDFIEIWNEGLLYHKKTIRVEIFEFESHWRLRLGMDAQGGGGFYIDPKY